MPYLAIFLGIELFLVVCSITEGVANFFKFKCFAY